MTSRRGFWLGIFGGLIVAAGLIHAANSVFAGGGVPPPGADGTVLSADAASPQGMHWVSAPGGGDALTANPLSQFAATTSAQFAGVISDEVGTGKVILQTSPTLITPVLGVATATTINKVTITQPATGSTLTIADGLTLTANVTTTLAGTGGTITLQGSDTYVGRATTDTLTNKTLTSSTDVLGGVTMTLGSDATGDIYYRDSFGLLHRLPIGSSGNVLTVTAGLPSWQVATGGGNVSVSGTPTAGHVATWTNATTIQDGGILPNFTPTGGIDELIYYQGSGDNAFHPVTLANGISLNAGALGLGSITLNNGNSLQTDTTSGHTALLRAYNTGGSSYTTFATLTAGASPSFDLAAAVTHNGQTIADAANSLTLTNKTIDAANNTLTFPITLFLTPAVCQGGSTASIGFSSQASGAAVGTCGGTTITYATVDFANSGATEVQFHVPIPTDWDGNAMTVTGKWRTSATSGNIVWHVTGACAGDGAVVPTSYSSTADAVTDAAKGTTLQQNDFSITASVSANHSLAGCSAGNEWYLRFYRDKGDGSDTLAAVASLLSLNITLTESK